MSQKRYIRADYLRIKALQDTGLTNKEIADKLELTKDTVTRLLRKGDQLPEELPNRVPVKQISEDLFRHDPYYKF